MIKFLKGLFTSSGDGKRNAEPVTEYKGFNIQPIPQEASGGWSTEAIITKEIDAEIKTHHFIRADKTSGKDGAIELTISKAKRMIDQVGENLFSK